MRCSRGRGGAYVVREEVPVGRLTHLYVLRRERTEPAKKRLRCHNKGITEAGAWTSVQETRGLVCEREQSENFPGFIY